jgi:hypothetical protein
MEEVAAGEASSVFPPGGDNKRAASDGMLTAL